MFPASADRGGMLITASLGYGCSVIERRPFLQSLYDQLKNKQSVHVDKRVNTVTQTGHGIVVKCQDGSEYHGV
jgi:FAD dependent monooxygenase